MSRIFESSELILNPDGSAFHLHIKPGELGKYVLLVGDPGRVDLISSFFDDKLHSSSNREFYSVTGTYSGIKITALSTGIGTDNIDIVLNELDALVNIDFNTRQRKDQTESLNLIRIGTSGAIQDDIEPGSFVVSKAVIGFDGVLNFYKLRNDVCNLNLEKEFRKHSTWPEILPAPYCVNVDTELYDIFKREFISGITISANGFYAPQGRELRAEIAFPDMFNNFHKFRFNSDRITNFEMECSALYGLSRIFGHRALTVCAIIANRSKKTYLGDYSAAISKLIKTVLSGIAKNDERQ